jgi:hypothetical protein
MLGIEDKWVFLAYVLSILSALFCVIYGAMNWNRGDDAVDASDVRWAAHEQKDQQEM